MKRRILFVLMAFLFLGGNAIFCYAQPRHTTDIDVEQVNGQLVSNPSFVLLSATSNTGTFRWSSKGFKKPLSIEFFYANPCDPLRSHLDQNPATCVVLPGFVGTYAYKVISGPQKQESDGPEDIAFARVGSCGNCRPPDPKLLGGIACSGDAAKVVPENLTVSRGSAIMWTPLGPGNPKFTISFAAKNPCSEGKLSSTVPVCSLVQAAGQYTYTATRDGCSAAGRGLITVK